MFSALVAMKSAVIIITLYFFGCTGEVEELFAQFLLHLFPVGGVAQLQVVPQGLDSVNGSSVNMGCTSSLVDSGGVMVCESRSYLVDGCSPDIRASVDALCRDDPSEISRDTRTKCLQTRRESLARPSKHTNNNF